MDEHLQSIQRNWNDTRRPSLEQRRLARVREAETLCRLRKRLVTAVDRWEKATRIRSFLVAMEPILEGLPASQAASAKLWVEWAYEQARLLDPLDEGQLEHLCSRRVNVPKHFDGWYSYDRPKPDWWSGRNEEE